MALIAAILRRFSFSRDVSGSVKMTFIKRRCSGVNWSDYFNASFVSSSIIFLDNCCSLSITSCSFLKQFSNSIKNNLCCCYFLLRKRRIAFWYFSFLSVSPRAFDNFVMRRFNLRMHKKLLINVNCVKVKYRGRRGSIERFIKYMNFIKSF